MAASISASSTEVDACVRMPILGACATRFSGAAGSIRPKPPKPGRSLVAASCAAVPGTTIQTTSAPRTATGTLPTTGTTTSASGSPVRFPPEPARSRWRRACAERPGPSMMSTVGARGRPIPRRRRSWETHGLRPAPLALRSRYGWLPPDSREIPEKPQVHARRSHRHHRTLRLARLHQLAGLGETKALKSLGSESKGRHYRSRAISSLGGG
jgi:hypothetical protein